MWVERGSTEFFDVLVVTPNVMTLSANHCTVNPWGKRNIKPECTIIAGNIVRQAT